MPVLDLDALHLRIVHGGRDWLGPWWHLRQVRGPGWIVYCNDRDGARIVVAGKTYPLRAGRVMVIPPHVAYDTSPGREVRQVYFHVEVLGLLPSDAEALLPAPLDLGDDPVLAAQAARLHALMPDGGMPGPQEPAPAWAPLIGLAFVHQAFARLIECSGLAQRVTWSERMRTHGPMAGALRYIDRNLARPLYVATLAKQCGMSPQWFTERFRATMGATPAQYILERRMAAAARRLALSDEPIPQVAAACGFSDRAYFTRVFSARQGITPAAYRRREQARATRRPAAEKTVRTRRS